MSEYLIGVDLGGTKIVVSLASEDGIIEEIREATKLEGDMETIPRQIKSMILRLCDKAAVDQNRIGAVGVAAVGPFWKKEGRVRLVAPNLCGVLAKERGVLPNEWKEIPLEENLSDFERVVIANDCVAAVIAEKMFGAGRGYKNMVYVTWSTGIGTGAIVDGRLIEGRNGNAPHGGHIFLAEEGPLCGCGQKGDFESLCSGPAIAKAYGDVFSTEKVFTAFRGDDSRAKKIIWQVAKIFGRGLASINNLLDTEIFIIGGSVFVSNQDVLLPLVREEFSKSFPVFSRGVEIVPAKLGKNLEQLAPLCLVLPEAWQEKWRTLINYPPKVSR